jgi:hypothetical protein
MMVSAITKNKKPDRDTTIGAANRTSSPLWRFKRPRMPSVASLVLMGGTDLSIHVLDMKIPKVSLQRTVNGMHENHSERFYMAALAAKVLKCPNPHQ